VEATASTGVCLKIGTERLAEPQRKKKSFLKGGPMEKAAKWARRSYCNRLDVRGERKPIQKAGEVCAALKRKCWGKQVEKEQKERGAKKPTQHNNGTERTVDPKPGTYFAGDNHLDLLREKNNGGNMCRCGNGPGSVRSRGGGGGVVVMQMGKCLFMRL